MTSVPHPGEDLSIYQLLNAVNRKIIKASCNRFVNLCVAQVIFLIVFCSIRADFTLGQVRKSNDTYDSFMTAVEYSSVCLNTKLGTSPPESVPFEMLSLRSIGSTLISSP